MTITHVTDYVRDKVAAEGVKQTQLDLNLSTAMISKYKNNLQYGFNASLDVAKLAYEKDKVVLHPYSEESLHYEIQKDKGLL